MFKHLILIIDDDPTQHVILRGYLKSAGYDIAHAENGEQGLKILEERRPDLILLDIQMPGLDGFEVLEEIRKKKENSDVAVLFLTALDYQHLKVQGLEVGADDYITKPFDKEELLARISSIIRRMDRSRQKEGMMDGDLSDVGISDLLQSMELGLKTAVIRMRDIDAEIVVENGKLIYARQGNFKDDQALLRIFLQEKGYFSIKFNEKPLNINEKPRNLTSVLMNISNQVDEINDIVKQMGVKNRRLKIRGDLSEFQSLKKIQKILPATFIDIITAMEGKIKDNIKILIDASQKRLLKIEKKN